MDRRIISIDPGQTGAIAEYYDGKVIVETMPSTIGDIWDYFNRSYRNNTIALIENVGGYVPGNAGPGAVKFSRHIGNLEMALYAAGVPTERVAPAVWMRGIGVPPKMDKANRKRWIKDAMQRMYPSIKVTLVNADALGLLTWGKSK